MAHLDHKESAVSPHHEWDVSKSPFGPPGIIELGLRSTKERACSTARASILIVSNFGLTRSVYHCGVRQKFITSTESSAEICGTNCALKTTRSPLLNTIPDPQRERVRALVRVYVCMCVRVCSPEMKKPESRTYAEHPFPMTPTRFPASDTSWRQTAECHLSPRNVSNPTRSSGILGCWNPPVALSTTLAETVRHAFDVTSSSRTV